VLFLDEIWWRRMSIKMHRTSLHEGSTKLAQLALSDIRTRSVCSVDKSIADLGSIVTTRDANVRGVALMRLRHALDALMIPDDLINRGTDRLALNERMAICCNLHDLFKSVTRDSESLDSGLCVLT